jgi:hypothetical protein
MARFGGPKKMPFWPDFGVLPDLVSFGGFWSIWWFLGILVDLGILMDFGQFGHFDGFWFIWVDLVKKRPFWWIWPDSAVLGGFWSKEAILVVLGSIWWIWSKRGHFRAFEVDSQFCVKTGKKRSILVKSGYRPATGIKAWFTCDTWFCSKSRVFCCFPRFSQKRPKTGKKHHFWGKAPDSMKSTKTSPNPPKWPLFTRIHPKQQNRAKSTKMASFDENPPKTAESGQIHQNPPKCPN